MDFNILRIVVPLISLSLFKYIWLQELTRVILCYSWERITLVWLVLAIGFVLSSSNSANYNHLTLKRSLLVFILSSLCFLFLVQGLMIFFFLFELNSVLIFIFVFMFGYQPERVAARISMFLYVGLASLPLLVVFLFMIFFGDVSSWLEINLLSRSWFYFFIIVAFLAKLPVFGLHSWLPKAHVEASAEGSILLASVLLKLGGVGILRVRPLLRPCYSSEFIVMWVVLSSGLLMWVCLSQRDLKIIVAYSSICHIRLIAAIGYLNSLNRFFTRLTIILAHGIVSSGLFFCVGVLFYHSNSRIKFFNRGLLSLRGLFSANWIVLLLFNLGVPPLLNFWIEFQAVRLLGPLRLVRFGGLIVIIFFTIFISLFLGTRTVYGVSSQQNKKLWSCHLINIGIIHTLIIRFITWHIRVFM